MFPFKSKKLETLQTHFDLDQQSRHTYVENRRSNCCIMPKLLIILRQLEKIAPKSLRILYDEL